MKYLIVPLLWAAYCALHSYLISISLTNKITRLLKNYYAFYRLLYVVFSLGLLIWLIDFSKQFEDEEIITYSPVWDVIRYIFMIGSLLMFFVAFFFSYDPLSFFGIRQAMNFIKPENKSSKPVLSRKGLLGLTRHPMYLALIIFLCSQNFTVMDIIINTVLIIYVLIGTVLEEKKLILEFGTEYEVYQKEVPMFIPFTKKKQLSLR